MGGGKENLLASNLFCVCCVCVVSALNNNTANINNDGIDRVGGGWGLELELEELGLGIGGIGELGLGIGELGIGEFGNLGGYIIVFTARRIHACMHKLLTHTAKMKKESGG